ncbi:GMC family oxidoreductase [Pseudoxanthomonas sp. PXM01]|uniref:GMC family oxidoreductase n=1 Tax=Pseudoxanthomonas sp. PXM01 TaxID=2769295 RepID=UPI0031BA7CF9
MILDANSAPLPSRIDADVCIVGAGPAGIALARSWLNTPVNVCLVEGGGHRPESLSQSLYEGAAVGDGRFDPVRSRLRALGGSTHVWGGGCIPLSNGDLSRRTWVPNSGWPLAYEALQPFYERARETFGIGHHALADGSFLQQDGQETHAVVSDLLEHRTFVRSPVFFGEAFRDELAQARNVTLLLHANVTSLDAGPEATHVESLTIRSLSGQTTRLVARQYVLACGGIENARLLLLSNDVAPEGLGNRHGLVGRYFMDHPTCRLGTLQGGVPERVTRPYDRTGGRGPTPSYPELCLSDAARAHYGLLNARVRPFAVEGAVPAGVRALRELRRAFRKPTHDEAMTLDGQLESAQPAVDASRTDRSITALGKAVATAGLHSGQVARAWYRKRHGKLPVAAERVDVVGYFEQAPNPDSRIRLGDERDALGQRKVVVDWRLTDLDWHTYRMSATIFGSELAKASAGRFTPDAWLADDARSDAPIHGTAHHMGTTRMASSAREGVVDLDARVHGVANLHVAGSSVFPTGGWAFPTFTIVAMSLRLAEHLHVLL